MKMLEFYEEHQKMINELAHLALKSAGVEAFQLVKRLEAWVNSGKDKEPEEKFKSVES